ncbi:hypothetical protein ACLB1G_04715 [Oxalobacteraceae bacterium A2-2]
MKTMKWLIKRELWEHKGSVIWAPAIVAALLAALALFSLFMGHNAGFVTDNGPQFVGNVVIEGKPLGQVADVMAAVYMASSLPVFAVLGFLVFFYCLGALNDERRDRSLLFWKSLPVSDHMTVLSKALLALVVTPLITMGISIVLSVVLILGVVLTMYVHGTNLFAGLLSSPDFYLSPLRVVGLLPVYILWALPTVGYLLLVSATVRSKVFLWAVGLPVVSALLLMWAERVLRLGVHAGPFITNIVNRILLGVVPGAWFLFHGGSGNPKGVLADAAGDGLIHGGALFKASWATLDDAGLWIGAVAGIAMIAGAIWMRRRREEV